MTSPKSPNGFHAITKKLISDHYGIEDSSELCGVASVTMLLQWCGEDVDLKDIYERMVAYGAYVKGTGTYLQRAAELSPRKLHYLRFAPSFIVFQLLKYRYCLAASIKESSGGSHIIFICGSDDGKIYYYDPNEDEALKNMPYAEWKRLSNKRALIMRTQAL